MDVLATTVDFSTLSATVQGILAIGLGIVGMFVVVKLIKRASRNI